MFVRVYRADGAHVGSANSAEVRRAVSDGIARWLSKDPPAVELASWLDRLPRTFGRARERHLVKTTTDFFNLFQEEQPLWVKTLVPGQVSISIQLENGSETSLLVPHTGDPVSLTDQAPFAALKNSMDLRKLALPRPGPINNGSRGMRPPAIRIMTHEEVREHYRKKAIKLDYVTPEGEPDIDRAMQPIITEPAVKPPVTRVPDPARNDDDLGNETEPPKPQPLYQAEAVEPRVYQLCLDANPQDNDNPLPADVMLLELSNMGELSNDSLNHVLAFGHHASVKRWAQAELAERAG